MKNFSTKVCLLFLCFVAFYSCEREVIEDTETIGGSTEEQTKSSIQEKTYSFSGDLYDETRPLTHFYYGESIVHENEYGKSYTIGIVPIDKAVYRNKNYYENLVVLEDNSGEINAFVVRYDSETDSPLTWEPVYGIVQSFPCGSVQVTATYPCACQDHHPPGDPSCPCSTQGYTVSYPEGIPCGVVYAEGEDGPPGGFGVGGNYSVGPTGGEDNPAGLGYPSYIPGNDYPDYLIPVPYSQHADLKEIDSEAAMKIAYLKSMTNYDQDISEWLQNNPYSELIQSLYNFFPPFYTLEDENSTVNKEQLVNDILEFVAEESSVSAENFANEMVSILNENPELDWSHIENWFLGEDPGSDSSEIINPENISYDTPLTQQDLPSMDDFVNNFPKEGTSGNYTEMSTPDVYELVGGTLWNSHQNDVNNNYQNACSIRGSRGLLYSGIEIPVLHYDTQRTQKGGDNKNYILDAVSFDKFMRDKFGSPTHELTGSDANDPVKIANMLKGKNGIYVIVNSDGRPKDQGGAGYSGHVDAIINGICISSAYTTPQGGVKSISIWELN